MTANQCVTLWVGDSLGPVERACFRSVLRHGHELALYVYREPSGVPEGVELRDAANILAESAVFHHRSGSVAFFADWFRYELLKRGAGTWVDTDLYLLAPLDIERPCLFGLETPEILNNCVLRLPTDSPILPPLLAVFEQRVVPKWLPLHHYLAARLRQWLNGEADVSKLPWGSTGPLALTAVAKRFGLSSQALPPDAFNPVPWHKADWIRDPAISLGEMTTRRTVGVHLWNECIKSFKNLPAVDGSFLARLHGEGAA
ncbi:MAG TPA: hypothetical protein VFP53_01210 [Sphingomicrobium sp.]|nr:hypothetical protein [Sphingomicrobium sp.]